MAYTEELASSQPRRRLPERYVAPFCDAKRHSDIIIDIVAHLAGLEKKDFLDSDARKVAARRQVAIYLMWRHTCYGLDAIGTFFDRHHTTVLYGIRRVEALIAREDFLTMEVIRVVEACLRRARN